MRHADAAEKSAVNTRKRKTKVANLAAYASLPKHRAFVPLITIWGGLLLALIASVLPSQTIASASSLTGVYLPLMAARLILATGMGILGALLGYIVSRTLAHRVQAKEGDRTLISTFESRDVQPINPVADLGSESFDAPIGKNEPVDEGEFADFSEFREDTEQHEASLGELSQRGDSTEAPEEFEEETKRHKKGDWTVTREHLKDALVESPECSPCEAASPPVAQPFGNDPQPTTGPQPAVQEQAGFAPLKADAIARKGDRPRALDLNEFASIPGRDAVWVSEPNVTAGNAAEKITPEPSKAPMPESALEKLRQTPTQDLSLVQMVERFAAALHQRQTHDRASISSGEVAREAALAEALKALAMFTDAGFDNGNSAHSVNSQIDKTEAELKDAIARLQEVRGAA